MGEWSRPGSRMVRGRVKGIDRVGHDLLVRAEVLEDGEEVLFWSPERAGLEPDAEGLLRWIPRSARDGWRGTGRGSWSFHPAEIPRVIHGENGGGLEPMGEVGGGVIHGEPPPPSPCDGGSTEDGNPLES